MVEVKERAKADASPLHFARFEFKYILSAAKRKAVEKDLLYFLDYDPFVAQLPDHRYFVRSLYFDDLNYSAFHDKIDGLKSRYKFRVRTYTQTFTGSAPIFLEIKGRHNNLVYKHRTPVQSETNWGIPWLVTAFPVSYSAKQVKVWFEISLNMIFTANPFSRLR